LEQLLKLPEEFLKRLSKSPIVDSILEKSQIKTKLAVMKHGGSKKKHVTGVEKLVDANLSGGTLTSAPFSLLISYLFLVLRN
jgi:hypothetical protein